MDERITRAIALHEAGKVEDALKEFEELASMTVDAQMKSSLLGNQANCLSRLGRFKEARQRLSEAEKHWTNVYTEFLDACLYIGEGKPEDALRELTRFLENYPDLKKSNDQDLYSEAQERVGLLYCQLERYLDAVDPLQEALSLPGTDDLKRDLCFYLGVCHRQNGNLEAAEDKLMQSLPTDTRGPSWTRSQYQLGCVLFERGAYLEAKKAFELSAFFMDGTDLELKRSVPEWLAETRRKLGEPSNPQTQ